MVSVNAQINVSKAGLQYANADEQNEIFQHKTKVINAYLDVLTDGELVKEYQNNLNKNGNQPASKYNRLLYSGIKPGVDTAITQS